MDTDAWTKVHPTEGAAATPITTDLTARIRDWARVKGGWMFFFGTSFVVFSSFFLEGKVLLSSSDSTFAHFPNLIFGHRMLRQGDFGLWNPLIFNGIDFSGSFHHHMLNPLNWPLLLLPERWLLHGVTFQLYVEISSTGLLVFNIIRRVQDDDTIALFVGVVAQLGGFAWFTTTTLIGTHLLFASTAAIYTIISHAVRRPALNYLFLTLCFCDMLMIGHVVYIGAFGLPIIVVFLWQIWSSRTGPTGLVHPWRGLLPATALAFVTACCISAVRVWPVMQSLLFEQCAVDAQMGFGTSGDHGYLALTGFVPEIMGLHYIDAARIGKALGNSGRHTQFHNFLYYGIVPILLVWLSVLRGLGSKSFGMAAIYLSVAVTPLFLVQPISDLVNIIVWPLNHDIMCRTGGAFLLCAALVPILRELRDAGVAPLDWRLRWFLALVGVVLASSLAMFVRAAEHVPEVPRGQWQIAVLVAKVLILAGLPVCFLAAGRLKLNVATAGQVTRAVALGSLLTMVIIGGIALERGYFWNSWITFRGFAYALASACWACSVIWLARMLLLRQARTRWEWALPIGMAAVALLICLMPIDEYAGKRGINVLMMSSAISLVKFAFLAAVAVEIVVLCSATPAGRKQLVPLLGLLTLGELTCQTKLYSHVGTHPFIDVADLYPNAPDLSSPDPNSPDPNSLAQARGDGGPVPFDTKNYRINKPLEVLRWCDSEALGKVKSEVPSNINMVYGVPTYAGVDSDVKRDLIQLLEAFGGRPEGWRYRQGIAGTLTNPRLLDISGVKYDSEGDQLVVRPNALARLSLFHHYEVHADRTEMLGRLNQPDFDPSRTIVLDASPRQPAGSSQRFEQVEYQSHGSSRLATRIDVSEQTILLFNDSYSQYWTCTCNGQALPVMHANGNFMAVTLPSGTCDVQWEFRPTPVLRLFWLSAAATLVLAGVTCASLISRKRPAADTVVPLKLAA